MYKKKITQEWFENLRDQICKEFEIIEQEYNLNPALSPGTFARKEWKYSQTGGGCMAIMKGRVFEKVGVNVSTIEGEFSEDFRHKVLGASNNPKFFATGISLVAHMRSPFVPAVHFNTRFLATENTWFGGGSDLTPLYADNEEKDSFHNILKKACDKYDPDYYPKFSKQCDEYFYIKHRKEPRGIGGIFFDHLNSGNFETDFEFVKDIGKSFLEIYPAIVRNKMDKEWSEKEREELLIKRGRYVEFNLIYDRGTEFGLKTGGNVEAILMSMPPEVKWV